MAKPDPTPFRAALAAVGAEVGVMIGDSLGKDVRGALDAGLDAVWLNRGHESPDAPAGVPVTPSMAAAAAAVSRFT